MNQSPPPETNFKPCPCDYTIAARTAQTGCFLAYDYYNPELAGEERPIRLTVTKSES